VNDELAQRNMPKPIYKTWKERVNDDLAACTAVENPWSSTKIAYKRKNESLGVDHIFTINTTTINTNTTRTNKNDAFRPFASFCSICRSLGVGGLFTNIFNVLKFLQQNNFQRSSEPVFIPIVIRRNSAYEQVMRVKDKNNKISY
jgi:hypothetical protein